MTGSMYAAVAGLKAHMQNLNVIGNNVANVNTQGYKAGRSVFRTSIYTSLNGGSNGTDTVGGRNPSQIGYGVALSSVDIDMSTGTYNPTGKATDCMIDGDGFFLVGKKDLAGTLYNDYVNKEIDPKGAAALTLTRVGNFEFKADGYLTDNLGNVVYGFLCTGYDPTTNEAIFSDQLVPIRVPGYDSTNGEIQYPSEYQPQEDLDTEGNFVYPTDKTATDDEKPGRLDDRKRPILNADGDVTGEEYYPKAQLTSISIDPATGIITGMSEKGKPVTVGCIAIGTVNNPNGVTQLSNTYYKAGDGSGDLSINALGGATSVLGFDRMFENAYAKNILADDEEPTRGVIDATTIRGGGDTSLITSGLESSKTDLAQEISNMIVTQRGYQANTRIITVTDSMLEELVNMKR